MKAECAFEELGPGACSTGKGYVGWAEAAPCLPCPDECMTCHVDKSQMKKKQFKCNLKPIVIFPSPALTSMTDSWISSSDSAVSDLYKLPEGLTCSEPVQ